MRTLTASVSFLALVLLAPAARAAEGELVLAFEPGYALLSGEATAQHGGSGAGSAWIGLSDELWLAFGGGAGYVGADDPIGARRYGEAFGGIVAALDVFRTIPFLEAQIGMVTSSDVLSPTVRIGLGADYFVSRTLSVGLVARVRPVREDIGGTLLTASLRLAWRIAL